MSNKSRYLTQDQVRVERWLATPQRLRNPVTEEELAQEIGVQLSTIRRWRERLDLDGYASEFARQELFAELPEIYEIVAEKAKTGSLAHVKLFLEIAAEHGKKLVGPEGVAGRSIP